MIHRTARKITGFTLVELMVVIGIMAVLMAMIFPATQSLRRGNRVMTCAFQLQQISNAMKAYHFDWGSVPPVYILEQDQPFNPASPPTDPYNEISDPNTEPYNNGLHILFEAGYLSNRRALHCPSDTDHADPNSPEYYESFTGLDENAKYDYAINRYKYMPCRTWAVAGDLIAPDPVAGQLAPRVNPEWIWDEATGTNRWAWVAVAGGLNDTWEEVDVGGTVWYPDDSTVVAWCNFHTAEYFRDGEGQYQVLFWDGSTKTFPAIMFAAGEPGAIPVWQADPD